MKMQSCVSDESTLRVALLLLVLTVVVLLAATVLLWGEVEAASGTFGGGDGTAMKPYQIEDVADLQTMNADLDGHYVLANDIDASVTREWNNGSGFDPIGDESNHFTGSLDGKGHWISGLFINRSSEGRVALFSFLEAGGSISNVNLMKVNISGNHTVGTLVGWSFGTVKNSHIAGTVSGIGNNVGGVVGINYDTGTLQNCFFFGSVQGVQSVGGLAGSSSYMVTDSHTSGTVTGSVHVGGLVAYNVGTVKNSYSTSKVTGTTFVGGLLGGTGGTVQNSHAVGDVSGSQSTGGLAGAVFDNTMIESSFATGDVTGHENVGGLVGYHTGTVRNSHATGDVIGVSNPQEVGGLVGDSSGTVQNSYATGTVSGYQSAGGLIGTNRGSFQDCLATGDVSGNKYVGGLAGYNAYNGVFMNSYTTGLVIGNELVGGLVGKNANDSLQNNSFWDTETSGQATGGWGVGKNTTNMMMNTTFTDSGWDFNDTWDIVEEQSYPYLRVFTYAPVFVTEDVVETLEDEAYSVSYTAAVFSLPGETVAPSLQWKMNSDVGWLNMSATGVLSGTPTNDEVGRYWVNVSVADDKGSSNHRTFWLTVINVNDQPVVQTSALPNATAGKTYRVELTALDVDGDTLVWSVESNANWLTVKPGTSTMQGKPSGTGSYWVLLTADDGNGGTDSVNLTLMVEKGKDDDGGFLPGFQMAITVMGIVVSLVFYRRKGLGQ